jgi:hypothetical protein
MDAMALTEAGSSGSKDMTDVGTLAVVAGEGSSVPLAGVVLGANGRRGITGMLAGWPRSILSFAFADHAALWVGVTKFGTICGGFVGKLGVGPCWSWDANDTGTRGGCDMTHE